MGVSPYFREILLLLLLLLLLLIIVPIWTLQVESRGPGRIHQIYAIITPGGRQGRGGEDHGRWFVDAHLGQWRPSPASLNEWEHIRILQEEPMWPRWASACVRIKCVRVHLISCFHSGFCLISRRSTDVTSRRGINSVGRFYLHVVRRWATTTTSARRRLTSYRESISSTPPNHRGLATIVLNIKLS